MGTWINGLLTEDFISISIKVNKGKDFYNKLTENVDLEMLLYVNEYDISKSCIKDSNDNNYKVQLLDYNFENSEFIYYIDIYIIKGKGKVFNQKRKSKYQKQLYINKQIDKYINTIGIVNSQVAHSQDLIVDEYVPLRDYLKLNKEEFLPKQLYTKDFFGNIIPLRHKNLFSVYKDEISDFEKFTFIKRDDKNLVNVFHKLDEKILDYNQDKTNLVDRKNAREFAKEIYHQKGLYKDSEILKTLKNQDVHIKVEKVLTAKHKDVWSKILKKDMNINILEKQIQKYYKSKPEREKNIQLKYLSKREKKRKKRRENKKYIVEGLNEYFLNDNYNEGKI